MGDIMQFPGGTDETGEDWEKYLQDYLTTIFHSKEKRDHVIARMKEYYEMPRKLEWDLAFENLDMHPQGSARIHEGNYRECPQ